jgi:hypothetical protein
LSFTLSTQTANTVFAGPTTGSAAAPTFRALVFADLPAIPSGTILWNQIGAASGNLTLANTTFTTTFNQTSNIAWLWANTTVATVSTTNASPLHEFAANYWTGAASAQDTWTIGSSLAAGTNGVSTLTIGHSGSSGQATVKVQSAGASNVALGFTGGSAGIGPGINGANTLSINASGSLFANFTAAGVQAPVLGMFGWGSLNTVATLDTAISRVSAGVIGVGTGAQGSVAGALQLNKLYGPSANSDLQGTITSVSGTTVSKTFAVNYTSTPIVTVTPTTNAGAFYLSAVSNSGFTVTYGTSGAQTFNYHTIGNPN